MNKALFLFLFISGCFSLQSCAQTQSLTETNQIQQQDQARVIILATGGTIAGAGASETKASYKAGELPIEDLLKAVPDIHSKAQIKGEQISNIGSQDMTIEAWLKLSNRINAIFNNDEADAVVITHGTDTMEETAYFLSLTVQSNRPVVIVGAMRAATSLSQDGNRNLLDAVTVASSPESKNIGVVVAMNEQIFAAKDVDKTSTTNTGAFASRNAGPIGVVFDNKVKYYHQNLQQNQLKFDIREFGALPRVDIVYGYVDAEPQIVDFSVKNGALGIVYAGVGNGNFSEAVQTSLANASAQGVTVIRSSRIGKGRVTLANEVDDEKYGFIVADNLNPQKARILLMLALTKTNDQKEIQKMIFGE